MEQIDREAAEGEGESKWLCCMCTAAGQAIGEQGMKLSIRLMANQMRDHPSMAWHSRQCVMMVRQIARLLTSTRPLGLNTRMVGQHMRPHVAGRICPTAMRQQHSGLHVERAALRCCALFYSGQLADGLIEGEDTGFMKHEAANSLDFKELGRESRRISLIHSID